MRSMSCYQTCVAPPADFNQTREGAKPSCSCIFSKVHFEEVWQSVAGERRGYGPYDDFYDMIVILLVLAPRAYAINRCLLLHKNARSILQQLQT